MSQRKEQNLFFLNLPDLRKLCCVSLSLCCGSDDGEQRNTQVKMCRDLLGLYPDILASPALESFGEVTVIMAITFFKSGIIQAYAQRHGLQMGIPQRVLPGSLQVCLSYSLIFKLAPNWNKVGQLLVAGTDFLSDSGKLNAVGMQLSVSEGQLCLSMEANTVRLPPTTLEDFDIAPNAVRNFHSCRDAVINSFSLPSNWCFILPSMKKGQIISISHQLPPECPFRSYADIRRHWNSLYGYLLPPVDEQDVVYCSVYFKLVGERLFTYPLCCIRAEPIQRFPRVDLQGALSSFLSDLRGKLQSVCGFPVRMTTKPCYHTTSLTALGSQSSSTRPMNLTTKAVCRPVLTQLPGSSPRNAPPGGAAQDRCPSQQGGPSSSTQCRKGEGGAHFAWMVSGTRLIGAIQKNRPVSTPTSSAITPAPTNRILPIFRSKVLVQPVNITKILAERRRQRQDEVHQDPAGPNRLVLGPTPSSQQRPEARLGTVPALSHQPHPTPQPSKTIPQASTMRAEIPALIPSSKGGDWIQSKPKKPKVSTEEVDVEQYARNNQLSKINSATLQEWLRGRGILVRSKDRKEELVTKVMNCLSEP